MREIRGIQVDAPEGVERIIVITRDETGEDYQNHDITAIKPLNKKELTDYLRRKFGCKPEEIVFPKHIKIPE